MTAVIRVAIVLTVLFGMHGRAAAPHVPQGNANARLAFPVPEAVRVVRDITYVQYGQRQLKLDLYVPPASAGSQAVPGILVVRGGGWRSGDKEAFAFIAGQLAMAGFAAASIEYRTSAEAKFPAAVQDVQAAVRWMRANAATHGIDGRALGAIGGSAGGHLVAMLATGDGASGLAGVGGGAAVTSQVQAVVAMACVCNLASKGAAVVEFLGDPLGGDDDVVRAASPVSHVNRRSAPILLLHSRTDPVVPFAQSVEMEAAYRRAGVIVELKAVDAPGTHAFWNETRYFRDTMSQSIDFFRRHLTVFR